MATEKYNSTSMDANFVRKYQKGSRLMYDGGVTPLLSQIPKRFDLSGEDFRELAELSMGWGVGSGSLPEASVKSTEQVVITEADIYARAKIDRKAIYKSKMGGAFIDALADSVESTVRGFSWNVERQLMNDQTGALGTIDSGGVSGSGPYDCTISSATWKRANFEVGILVNVGTNSTLFKVTAVTPSTRVVELTVATGTYTPVAADIIYMQGSKDNDLIGIKKVGDATSSTLYGVTVQDRWQAVQKDAGSAAISTELLDEQALEQLDYIGKGPKIWLTSTTQWRKQSAQLEDQKRYAVLESKVLKGKLSFKGLEYVGPTGDAPIITSRFCEADRCYGLIPEDVQLRHLPGGGWMADDLAGGKVWARETESDSYEARYGYYMQAVIYPPSVIRIKTLAT